MIFLFRLFTVFLNLIIFFSFWIYELMLHV